jgi:hypothetical protein
MSQASTITLDVVKLALRVTHDHDDEDLERRLRSAEQECLRYTGRSQLPTLPVDYPGVSDCPSDVPSEEVPSSEDPVAPDVVEGIILMVQAGYEGDPQDRASYRKGAEALWSPYRVGWGA